MDRAPGCAHRFPAIRVPGYEADDVIGTLAERAVKSGIEVVIVSSDKDFAQLVGDQVRVYDILDVTYDAELWKKFGVPPRQIADLFALMGDDIDNIPGGATTRVHDVKSRDAGSRPTGKRAAPASHDKGEARGADDGDGVVGVACGAVATARRAAGWALPAMQSKARS